MVLTPLEEQLAKVDEKLQQLAAHEPISHLLMTAPGVGLVTSLMFMSVLDEAKRFGRAHQVESYLGLVPSEDSTGGQRRVGSISKCGNPYLALAPGASGLEHLASCPSRRPAAGLGPGHRRAPRQACCDRRGRSSTRRRALVDVAHGHLLRSENARPSQRRGAPPTSPSDPKARHRHAARKRQSRTPRAS